MEQHHATCTATAGPERITVAIEIQGGQSGHTVSHVRPSPPPVRHARRRPAARLVISPRTQTFRKRFFPSVSAHDWNDWRWQLRHRIKDLDTLARIIHLSDDERTAITRHQGALPVGLNPYYASLLDPDDSHQPLRYTVVPVNGEYMRAPEEADDPLSEDSHSPVPGLVHRYPDRVLFLVTGFCSVYCRYCTRSRMVAHGRVPRWRESFLHGAVGRRHRVH